MLLNTRIQLKYFIYSSPVGVLLHQRAPIRFQLHDDVDPTRQGIALEFVSFAPMFSAESALNSTFDRGKYWNCIEQFVLSMESE